jgi:PTS system mannose-specific IIC component
MIDSVLLCSGMAVLCGLDRTAFLQLMLSRPVVAAPLTGILLGSPETGLIVGASLELLWLGRLPMGATIPPDDTQVAVAGTFLAITATNGSMLPAPDMTLLALLIALPLGKVGIYFDQLVRKRNTALWKTADSKVSSGDYSSIERTHLRGLLHFAIASLATFLVISGAGWFIMQFLAPLASKVFNGLSQWLILVFPVVGLSHVLANMNVNRTLTLFVSSFLMTFVLLWLI